MKYRKRSTSASKFQVPVGQHMPAFVIPQVDGGTICKEAAAQLLFVRDLLPTQSGQCLLEHWYAGPVAVHDLGCHPIEKEVRRKQEIRPRGGQCDLRYLPHTCTCGRRAGEACGRQRIQIANARQGELQWLKPFAG